MEERRLQRRHAWDARLTREYRGTSLMRNTQSPRMTIGLGHGATVGS